MKKRALFTVPISILLIAVIVTSFFLMNIKPDTSHISRAKKLAEYSKPAVVRVYDYAIVQWEFYDYFPEVEAILQQMNYQTFVGGYGSGAIISPDGYIVTNAHVVSTTQMTDDEILQEALIRLSAVVADAFQTDVETAYLYLIQVLGYTNLTRQTEVVLPGGDVLDGEIKSYGSPIGEKDGDWKDVAVLKIEGKNLPTLKLGNSDDVEDQENIWAIGYPSLAEYNVLSIDSSLESTMNSGEISATSKKLETGTSVIQLNAATSTGNSGGPIINSKGEIVGLLTFGAEVTGFDFAIPVNTVKEFVNQAGAKNKSSETDKLFKEGLELYWGGYYEDALEKFESVQRIYPNHSTIKKYIQDAEEKADDSKILWSNYQTLFYIIDGVAAVLVIVLMLFTFVFVKKEPKVMAITATGPGLDGGANANAPNTEAIPEASQPPTPENTPEKPDE
ncbi:trypsin-like serine protease [Bacillus sp. DNRA2]|uniref:S1C family serine protease n=1 Tax=Bacillus sp. DNRA2 TaxID=2723053 RepID=UPI00145C7C1B|nr:trypsin-like peptidase domain-containing protein [Bacillus sp. DNRA2]NMD68766.1 trypsin-like serine protease [Bacillus sp. DNRA2]